MNNNNGSTAMSRIRDAMMSRADSPSAFAQVAAAFSERTAGAEDAVAQGLQMAWDGGVAFSEEYMTAAYNQHAPDPLPIEGVHYQKNELGEISPIEPLSDNGENFTYDESTGETTYHAAYNDENQSETNKGIESFREKSKEIQMNDSETNQNEGIEKFREITNENEIEQDTEVEQDIEVEQDTEIEQDIDVEEDIEIEQDIKQQGVNL